jgi:hypothetical protein
VRSFEKGGHVICIVLRLRVRRREQCFRQDRH